MDEVAVVVMAHALGGWSNVTAAAAYFSSVSVITYITHVLLSTKRITLNEGDGKALQPLRFCPT